MPRTIRKEHRPDLQQILPLVLKELRRTFHWGSIELAEHLGTNEFTMICWVQGRRPIGNPKMMLLALVTLYASMGMPERGWQLYRTYLLKPEDSDIESAEA